MDVKRLAQIIWMDADRKAAITENKNLSPAVIQNGFSITSQVNHSMAVMPANNNVLTDDARKLSLAKDFRSNEREMIAGQAVAVPAPYVIPTTQKIKTNVFASAMRNILHWSPLDRFSTAASIKSKPYVAPVQPDAVPAKIIAMDGNVVPFKRRKTLTLSA